MVPLAELKQLQLGAIRTHKYQNKSTKGKETPNTEVKLTRVKKTPSQKPTICSNTNLTPL